MEHTGIEPAASCLQNRRRPIATNTPYSPAAFFLPAYLTYLLYTFSVPSSNLTVTLSGYPDRSDVYGRYLILTIFPFFLCPVSHCSHFFLSLYSVPQISHFQSVVSFIFSFSFLLFCFRKIKSAAEKSAKYFFCSFYRVFFLYTYSMPEFSKMRNFLRIIFSGIFYAFLVSVFSQEPDKINRCISMSAKNKWTVEESNL